MKKYRAEIVELATGDVLEIRELTRRNMDARTFRRLCGNLADVAQAAKYRLAIMHMSCNGRYMCSVSYSEEERRWPEIEITGALQVLRARGEGSDVWPLRQYVIAG